MHRENGGGRCRPSCLEGCGCIAWDKIRAGCGCITWDKIRAGCGCITWDKIRAGCGCITWDNIRAGCACITWDNIRAGCGCITWNNIRAGCGQFVPLGFFVVAEAIALPLIWVLIPQLSNKTDVDMGIYTAIALLAGYRLSYLLYVYLRKKGLVEIPPMREPRPNPENNPVGEIQISLAFAGGGIRAASICSGVLARLFEKVDGEKEKFQIKEISCVSGGGYVGSAYCVWLRSYLEYSRSFNPKRMETSEWFRWHLQYLVENTGFIVNWNSQFLMPLIHFMYAVMFMLIAPIVMGLASIAPVVLMIVDVLLIVFPEIFWYVRELSPDVALGVDESACLALTSWVSVNNITGTVVVFDPYTWAFRDLFILSAMIFSVGSLAFAVSMYREHRKGYNGADLQHYPVSSVWVMILSAIGWYSDVITIQCTGIEDMYIIFLWGLLFASMFISLFSHEAYGGIQFIASLAIFIAVGMAQALGPPQSVFDGVNTKAIAFGGANKIAVPFRGESITSNNPPFFVGLAESWGALLLVCSFILMFLPAVFAARNKIVQNCYRSMLSFAYLGGYSHQDRVDVFNSHRSGHNAQKRLVIRLLKRIKTFLFDLCIRFELGSAFFPCDDTTFHDLAQYGTEIPSFISQTASHMHFRTTGQARQEGEAHQEEDANLIQPVLTDGSVNRYPLTIEQDQEGGGMKINTHIPNEPPKIERERPLKVCTTVAVSAGALSSHMGDGGPQSPPSSMLSLIGGFCGRWVLFEKRSALAAMILDIVFFLMGLFLFFHATECSSAGASEISEAIQAGGKSGTGVIENPLYGACNSGGGFKIMSFVPLVVEGFAILLSVVMVGFTYTTGLIRLPYFQSIYAATQPMYLHSNKSNLQAGLLSDGGHVENLALLPLLSRKAKMIICVDSVDQDDPTEVANDLKDDPAEQVPQLVNGRPQQPAAARQEEEGRNNPLTRILHTKTTREWRVFEPTHAGRDLFRALKMAKENGWCKSFKVEPDELEKFFGTAVVQRFQWEELQLIGVNGINPGIPNGRGITSCRQRYLKIIVTYSDRATGTLLYIRPRPHTKLTPQEGDAPRQLLGSLKKRLANSILNGPQSANPQRAVGAQQADVEAQPANPRRAVGAQQADVEAQPANPQPAVGAQPADPQPKLLQLEFVTEDERKTMFTDALWFLKVLERLSCTPEAEQKYAKMSGINFMRLMVIFITCLGLGLALGALFGAIAQFLIIVAPTLETEDRQTQIQIFLMAYGGIVSMIGFFYRKQMSFRLMALATIVTGAFAVFLLDGIIPMIVFGVLAGCCLLVGMFKYIGLRCVNRSCGPLRGCLSKSKEIPGEAIVHVFGVLIVFLTVAGVVYAVEQQNGGESEIQLFMVLGAVVAMIAMTQVLILMYRAALYGTFPNHDTVIMQPFADSVVYRAYFQQGWAGMEECVGLLVRHPPGGAPPIDQAAAPPQDLPVNQEQEQPEAPQADPPIDQAAAPPQDLPVNQEQEQPEAPQADPPIDQAAAPPQDLPVNQEQEQPGAPQADPPIDQAAAPPQGNPEAPIGALGGSLPRAVALQQAGGDLQGAPPEGRPGPAGTAPSRGPGAQPRDSTEEEKADEPLADPRAIDAHGAVDDAMVTATIKVIPAPPPPVPKPNPPPRGPNSKSTTSPATANLTMAPPSTPANASASSRPKPTTPPRPKSTRQKPTSPRSKASTAPRSTTAMASQTPSDSSTGNPIFTQIKGAIASSSAPSASSQEMTVSNASEEDLRYL